jgi:hypothetical protein
VQPRVINREQSGRYVQCCTYQMKELKAKHKQQNQSDESFSRLLCRVAEAKMRTDTGTENKHDCREHVVAEF